MKRFFTLCFVLFLSSLPTFAVAFQSEISLKRDGYVFTPSPRDCVTRDICDLKEVVFRIEQFRLPPLDDEEGDIDLLGTRLYASYETTQIDQLEKYVFVQFIRGCSFFSVLRDDGTIDEHFGRARAAMFGRLMIFRHPLWSIDSNGHDPAYSASAEFPGYRHYLAQWREPAPKWVPDDEKGDLYGETKPTVPRLFMTDLPIAAWHRPDGLAQNASFEFRTCLYKTADVPIQTEGEHDVHFEEPVVCWNWKHNFVYNHPLKHFDQPETVAPICMRPFTPEEERIEKFLREPKEVATTIDAPSTREEK